VINPRSFMIILINVWRPKLNHFTNIIIFIIVILIMTKRIQKTVVNIIRTYIFINSYCIIKRLSNHQTLIIFTINQSH